MLMNKSRHQKIDRFSFVVVGIFIVISAIVIITFRSISSAFAITYEINVGGSDAELSIDKEKVNSSYDFVYNKQKSSPIENDI